MDRFFLFVVMLLLLPAFSPAQIAQVDSIVKAEITAEDPALFVGVVKDGAVVYKSIQGLESLQHQVLASENSRSNIASTAKQFTALMVLDLSMKGELSLEDDLRQYFPDLYPKVKETIKIRHLLNHTSGVRDYCDLMGIQQNAWWKRIGLDNDDVVELLEQQEDLAFAPGTNYEYSNSGYNLLTEIITQVTEEDFHSYSNRFFQELGMTKTTFLKNYMHVIPNHSLPYSDWGDGVWQQFPMLTNTYGEGFLFTTLDDQLHYEQLLQSAVKDGNQLLIQSQQPIANSERETYGFGLELTDRLNYPAVHHEGATGSYSCQVIRIPEAQLSVFVMTSNSRVWSYGLANKIASALLPEKEVAINYDARLADVPTQKLDKAFIGQYYSVNDELVRVEEEEGELVWLRGNRNPIALVREAENLYYPAYDDQLKIVFTGEQLEFFYPSGKTFVYTRQEIGEPTLADYESFVGNYYSKELEVNFSLSLEENDLMFHLDGWRKQRKVKVFNKVDLIVRSYFLKVERDQFNRVVAISLS